MVGRIYRAGSYIQTYLAMYLRINYISAIDSQSSSTNDTTRNNNLKSKTQSNYLLVVFFGFVVFVVTVHVYLKCKQARQIKRQQNNYEYTFEWEQE